MYCMAVQVVGLERPATVPDIHAGLILETDFTHSAFV